MNNSKCVLNKRFLLLTIFPCLFLALAIIFACVFGFNRGMDYKGGIEVSVMAQDVNFDDREEFDNFKASFDEVLNNNNVKASVYIEELDADTYNSVLVAKIDYTSEDYDELVNKLKSDFVSVFYSDRNEEEIDNLGLVVVERFEGFVTSWQIVSAILASLVMAITICVYAGFRMGLHSAFFGMTFAVINNFITMAVLMVVRVKFNSYTICLVPFVTILTLLVTFLFERRAKRFLKTTQKFEKATNFELANEAVKYNANKMKLFAYIALVLSLGFMLCNIANELFFLGLSIAISLFVIAYNYLFIMPYLFALTYVRKPAKNRVKTGNNKDNNELTKEDIMKEPDLNNLTTN